ncbi:MAG: zinc metallopeptidase [Verrucomicrobiae bacterium]|nr:zinc metallopeptidase [Verrucomicrobiae bacterium]
MSPIEWILLGFGMGVALWAEFKLKGAYARYSQVGTRLNVTGAQTAREILDRNGLRQVEIHEVPGELSDHYDPSRRAVFLSSDIFHGTSIASVAVAAHEVGHALQHQQAYGPLGLRMALVPITGFASRAAMFLVLGGVVLGNLPIASTLLWIGVGCYAILAFFQLVTLPVEYDASARAKVQLNQIGLVTREEFPGVERMLSAAAVTYVAAMLAALITLLRLILIARSRDHTTGRDR